ncbi:MAG: GyrI-like domain-containing protein [Coprobacillaceae bacterium]
MEDYTSKNEYIRRINKVQDYIDKHISNSFTLEELSEVAGFSKYHFHRIFKAITHESLLQYVNRSKLERATHLLSHRPDMSITNIAYYLGFTDSAIFSRSFKHLFKVSPNMYRKNYSKNCKDQYNISRYNKDVSDKKYKDSKQSIEGNIEIINIKKMKVSYLRHTGDYSKLAIEFPKLLEKLFISADEQNLLEENKTRILSIYHDHPEFTNPNNYKTSLCITIPDNRNVDVDGKLSTMEIAEGTYMVGHFYIPQHLYSVIWDYIYEEWLTNSGYVPSDGAPFEMYMNDYRMDKNNMHMVDIYLPVQPLSITSK